MLFGLGWMEIAVIVAIALLLFGKSLPGLARSAGKTLMDLKKGVDGVEDDLLGTTRK